jgi:hypothetical protein
MLIGIDVTVPALQVAPGQYVQENVSGFFLKGDGLFDLWGFHEHCFPTSGLAFQGQPV